MPDVVHLLGEFQLKGKIIKGFEFLLSLYVGILCDGQQKEILSTFGRLQKSRTLFLLAMP